MVDEDPHYWAKRAFDRADDWHNKQNEVTIQAGTLAVRSAFFLNGGACLALLAFLANTITSKDLDPVQRQLLATIIPTLSFFAWGAFLSVVATCLAYFVNRAYLASSFAETKSFTPPHIIKTAAAKRWGKIGDAFVVLSILAVGGSLTLFLLGLLKIASSLPQ